MHPGLSNDPRAFQRARIMLIFCVIAGTFCLTTILIGALTKPEFAIFYGLVALGHILVCSSCILLRYCSSMYIPSWVMVALVVLQLGQAPLWTGLLASPVLFTYPLATIFMGIIGGRRQALCTGSLLCIVAFLFSMVDTDVSFAAGSQLPLITLVVLIWCTLTAAMLALYNEHQQSMLLEKIQAELRERTDAQLYAEQANTAKDGFMAYLLRSVS